jgi:hypothetical protein
VVDAGLGTWYTGRVRRWRGVLDKSAVDQELARRLCAAFISYQLGVGIATQYKKTPENVGDLWYFLAALAKKLAMEGLDATYGDFAHLATETIQ